MSLSDLIEAMQDTPEQWTPPQPAPVPPGAAPERARIVDRADTFDHRYASIGDGSYRLLMSTNADGDSYED